MSPGTPAGIRDQEGNGGRRERGWDLSVAVATPGSDPLAPFVIGIEGRGNQGESEDGEEKLHKGREQGAKGTQDRGSRSK